MAEKVLAVVAHPDDETLGCGGALAKHAAAGDQIGLVVMADGLASRGGVSAANIAKRHGMCRRAWSILGGGKPENNYVFLHQFADNMMDNCALLEPVRFIERHIHAFRPTIVYTHWKGDLNVDHRVCYDAVHVSCRPQPGCTVKAIYHFEVPCSTRWGSGFEPNHYVGLTQDALETKAKACHEYAEELRPEPHPRSLERILALAKVRGASVGVDIAEAFVVGRQIA